MRASRRGKTYGSSISHHNLGCKGCLGSEHDARVQRKICGRVSVTAECLEINSKAESEGRDPTSTDTEARRLG